MNIFIIIPRSYPALGAHGEIENGRAAVGVRRKSGADGVTVKAERRSTATDRSAWRLGDTTRVPTGVVHREDVWQSQP